MSDPARQITIRRNKGFYAIFRKLVIRVDDAELLRIKAGEAIAVKLTPDAKQLVMQMDWVQSEPFDLADVGDGDTLVISVMRRSLKEMRSLQTIPFRIAIER